MISLAAALGQRTMMRLGLSTLAALTLASAEVCAQDATAHRIGVAVARHYGIPNPTCYAQIFARYAQLTRRPDGKINWYVPSTPPYRAELQSRCGIDRVPSSMAESRPGPTARETSPAAGVNRTAYQSGLRAAAQRGFSGSQAHCIARVFVRYASPSPSPYRAGVVDWFAVPSAAFQDEMRRACGALI
ncbi:MAG: hypothetical protein GY873_08395 [Bosea sp.]|uniref:hypothetical protein n=1 Tax=Bosea sp. (in: a-proteobacteria) TaxID=1871050 RepID=UPI0023A22409|nr:hypothetical protein [Bosea sp. (in: a-proteobacteria)]